MFPSSSHFVLYNPPSFTYLTEWKLNGMLRMQLVGDAVEGILASVLGRHGSPRREEGLFQSTGPREATKRELLDGVLPEPELAFQLQAVHVHWDGVERQRARHHQGRIVHNPGRQRWCCLPIRGAQLW